MSSQVMSSNQPMSTNTYKTVLNLLEDSGGSLFELQEDCSRESFSSHVWSRQQRQRCYWLFQNRSKDEAVIPARLQALMQRQSTAYMTNPAPTAYRGGPVLVALQSVSGKGKWQSIFFGYRTSHFRKGEILQPPIVLPNMAAESTDWQRRLVFFQLHQQRIVG